jgi:hypothetical protein
MNFKNLHKNLASACASIALVGAIQVNAAQVVTDMTTVVEVPAITGFTTTGAQMTGMTVTALFRGGFTETLAWTATGTQSGTVSGTDWGITESGTTFANEAWHVTNTSGSRLVELKFDGAPGLTVFDIIPSATITEGSATGKAFKSNLGDDNLIVATYSAAVKLIGAAAPLGDLFQRLSVDFTGVAYGGVSGAFKFSQDTDNSSRLNAVPAPAMLVFFGLGLLALRWSSRKA